MKIIKYLKLFITLNQLFLINLKIVETTILDFRSIILYIL